MARYKTKGGPDDFVRPIISMLDLGAHVEATLFDVVHDDDLTPAENVAAISGLAHLARTLSVTWAHRLPAYGHSGERVFYRLCGLSGEGEPPDHLLRRIGAPRGDSDEMAGDATPPRPRPRRHRRRRGRARKSRPITRWVAIEPDDDA